MTWPEPIARRDPVPPPGWPPAWQPRALVEVLVDGAWWPGELAEWLLLPAAHPAWATREPGYVPPGLPLWHGVVQWRRDLDGHGDIIPADRLRPRAVPGSPPRT